MYNKCFNEREKAAHNEKRAVHEASALKIDKDMAREIQSILNK